MRDDEWGMIDMEEYIHYDNLLNGDLHEVVPGKFVALKGPRDLGALEYSDDAGGYRRFSPSYYVDILQGFGVTTVVRLNEAEYDAGAFAEQGIAVLELPFDDCAPPPPHVAEAFLAAVDGAGGGSVAVHCKAGLGRTGTLIALYLMRTHGFTAREAMGWLRIMRPGSVIGEQQHYLCAVDTALQAARRRASGAAADLEHPSSAADAMSADSSSDGPSLRTCSQSAPDAVEPSVLAAQVCAGMLRRTASASSSSCHGDAKRLD
jgi:cell division cycle 14